MRFTVDLENKKILFHDSFNRKDVDKLFSLLNIENMDEFSFDIYKEPNNSHGIIDDETGQLFYTTTTTTSDLVLRDTYNQIYNQGQILCDD